MSNTGKETTLDEKFILGLGYDTPRLLPSGEWAALLEFLFTTGLVVGIEELSYRTRFCYPSRAEAAQALASWDGRADPPGPWIKEKGPGVDRNNPKSAEFKEIAIVAEPARRGGATA